MSAQPHLDPVVLQLGSVLSGRYRLGRRLGSGGMSEVFAAEDWVLHRPVAVKVFRTHHSTPADRQRFETETEILASLRHPGLVALYDAGTVPDPTGHDVPFLVMELVEGPSLAALLEERGALEAREVAVLGARLADALAHVHLRNVVHRDVKPANVLVDTYRTGSRPSLTARLADFGISRLVDATRITHDGTTLGTPAYLSPEQAQGASAGPPSDVYSLGLVLFECLTGSQAYPQQGAAAVVARLHSQPELPSEHGRGWAELLAAMTAVEPADRPTAVDVADALHEADGSGPVVAWTAPTLRQPAVRAPDTVLAPPEQRRAPDDERPAPQRREQPRPRPALDSWTLVLLALAAAVYLLWTWVG